jgi:20S proteasome subunit beta 1
LPPTRGRRQVRPPASALGPDTLVLSPPRTVRLTTPLAPAPGAYIANRTSDKLTPVAEKIYTCRSGSAADTQAMSDYVRLYLSHYVADTGKTPTVNVAAHLFKQISYGNKNRLTAGIICAGKYLFGFAREQWPGRRA